MCLRLILLAITAGAFIINVKAQYGFNVKKSYGETSHQIYFASYNNDGNYIITTGSDNSVIIWNADKGTIFRTLVGLKSRQNTALFSPDGKLLFSGGEDNLITIWDPTTSNISSTLKGHIGSVKSLDISPDGRYLASGGTDKTIRIWDMEEKSVVFELKGHKKDVNVLKFSPDGKILASGGADNMLSLWNTANWNITKSEEIHKGWIRDLAFNPDGTLIASCGDDGLIQISAVPDLKNIATLKGHKDWVQTIDFSPDGKYLLSGGHDQLIILWDVSTGKLLSQSNKQGQIVLAVDFCPLRSDFISACLLSEDLSTWALSGVTYSESQPSPLMVASPAPVINELPDNKQMPGEGVDKKEIPVESSMIELYSPVMTAGKIISVDNNIYLIGRANDPEGINVLLINKTPVKLSEAGVFQFKINLIKGENQVNIIAINNKGKMNEVNLTIDCAVEDKSGQKQGLTAPSEGKYYALLIGINDYQSQEITDLDNPLKDAQSLYEVLLAKYNFERDNIIFLKNPAHSEIITTLDGLTEKLTSKDNLLIFYAGHGYWDEKGKVGYWFPSDATKNSTVNWFRNSTLRDFIGSIQTKHTLLIADACFSGAIFKTRAAFTDAPQGIKTLDELPSRKAMTSGILQEVPDESVFIKYLVKRLDENEDEFLTSELLFSSFKTAVMNNSNNVPQYGVIQNVGDEGGDFIFIRK